MNNEFITDCKNLISEIARIKENVMQTNYMPKYPLIKAMQRLAEQQLTILENQLTLDNKIISNTCGS